MTAYNWAQPQRQPLKALVYIFFKTLRSLLKVLAPIILIFLFKNSKKESVSLEYISIIFSVFTLIVSFIQFRMFTFFIENKQRLIIQKGIFTRQQIILPIEKIQAVNINQQWLHRLSNLAEVSFDSPGSDEKEATITLTIQQAQAFKEEILSGKTDMLTDVENTTAAHSNKILLYNLDVTSLLKLGLTANHIETFFLTLTFGYTILENIKTASTEFHKKSVEMISGYFIYQSLAAILMLTLAVLALSIFISFVRIILKYANFQIATIQSKFSIHTGLINTKEILIPFSKIQFISWQANWLRTKANMYVLKFSSIGEINIKEKQKIEIPLTRLQYLPDLLSVYHPLVNSSNTQAIHISTLFVKRMFLLFIMPAFFIILAAGFYNVLLWLLGIIVLYHAISVYLYQRNFRLCMNDEVLQISKGRYGKSEVLLLWNKIQSIELKQSIYQTKNNLASVVLYTAGGAISIPYISIYTANKLVDYALYKMETENWR